eukprot:gene7576-17986_t
MVPDGVFGRAGLAALCPSLIYYTAWVAVAPFTPPHHAVRGLFPAPEYGLLIPAAVVTLGVLVAYTYLAVLMISAPPAGRGSHPALPHTHHTHDDDDDDQQRAGPAGGGAATAAAADAPPPRRMEAEVPAGGGGG